METIRELAKFNHIKYYDEPHLYYIDGERMTSATTFIGQFKEKFDSEYWSQKKADERGITKEEILEEWRIKALVSTEKGTYFHEYAENYLTNRIFPFPQDAVNGVLGEDNDVKERFDKLVTLFDKFYEASYGRLIPVRAEVVVGDKDMGICGMVDQLFFNEKSGKLEIWDWKTNKKIGKKNHWQQFKEPISHLDICEMNTYSLQLSLYKHIIESNTNLELGDSYIVWFNEKNEKYFPMKCHDYTLEIKAMLKDFKK
tara:strand:- start:9343 stop:10110 length:768 start_codon:yes stop_codon:yes gene_type:complete